MAMTVKCGRHPQILLFELSAIKLPGLIKVQAMILKFIFCLNIGDP